MKEINLYGNDVSNDDIYEKIYEKVRSHPQMSGESYGDALTAFAYAHHGISGNLRGQNGKVLLDEPSHISNENGVSLLSGLGCGAILTRDFFTNITPKTAEFAAKILPALSDENCFLVCMAMVSKSGVGYDELKETLGFGDEVLRGALDRLIAAGLVCVNAPEYDSSDKTYNIKDMYHTCLCFIMAVLEVLRYGNEHGITCCMGYGDFPIKLK